MKTLEKIIKSGPVVCDMGDYINFTIFTCDGTFPEVEIEHGDLEFLSKCESLNGEPIIVTYEDCNDGSYENYGMGACHIEVPFDVAEANGYYG